LFRRCSSQVRELRDRVRKTGQAIVGNSQLDQTGHAAHCLGQFFEGVLADVEVPQAAETAQRRRQSRKLVVMQVQEVAQLLEPVESARNLAELVVPKIEHPQMAQVADALGDLGQFIVGENERLKVRSIPDCVGHGTDCLLPER
jgi:hypothetical protein